MQNRKPMILVLAGPNGSGKGTIQNNSRLLRAFVLGEFFY